MKLKTIFLSFFILLFSYFFLTSNVLAHTFISNNLQKVCITSGTNTPPAQGTLFWVNVLNPPLNPAYKYISLDLWNSLSSHQKFYTKPVWTYISSGNCSSLNISYTSPSTTQQNTIPNSVPSTEVLPSTIPTVISSVPITTVAPVMTVTTVASATTPPVMTTVNVTLIPTVTIPVPTVTTTISTTRATTTTAPETTTTTTTTLTPYTTTTLISSQNQSETQSSLNQLAQYDPKYVLLYAFIAFLIFLIVNNSLKYMQIYKYGHKTWPQRIWEVVFK